MTGGKEEQTTETSLHE